MNDQDKNGYRLDEPIYLDYDINNLTTIKISHAEMLETIKNHFGKHGFVETGKTDEGITILENVRERNKKIINELFKKR